MAEMRGLQKFREHFADFKDRYVLIGGVASFITAEDNGATFRATKDFDIVLIIETLDESFTARFWEFISLGGYEIKEVGQEGEMRPVFYRFQKPADASYPQQLELFSRSPNGMRHPEDGTLTRIATDEGVSSLSAILLDDAYYEFLRGGVRESDHVSFIGPDRLIPFKAKAWIELSAQRAEHGNVDTKHIKKHRNDVLTLSQFLTEDPVLLSDTLRQDMERFLDGIGQEAIDLKALMIRGTMAEIEARLRSVFLSPQ